MKFGFVTCVQLGLSCIEQIYRIGGRLDVLITLHDHKVPNKSGRIYLDSFANQHQIPLVKINHVNDQEVLNAIAEYDLDWLFIIGWSQIASAAIINAPKQGCVGIHPTLLPLGRGRAAIPWAILKNLDVTGITMFKLDEGVDTGPILGQYRIPLTPTENATSLYTKMNEAHEILISQIYPLLAEGTQQLNVQDETKATYWEGRSPADGELFTDMNVEEVDRLVRATTQPYPGAFIQLDKLKRIIWEGLITDEPANGTTILAFANGQYKLLQYEDIVLD